MRILAISLIILRIFNLIRGQSEVDSEKVMGDSGWWSRRITEINRREGERIGELASQDKQRHDRRWPEETIIRDSRRRPRPFASALSSNAETLFQDRFESRRQNNFRNFQEAATITFDFNAPAEPSPVLLPPFATPSPVYRAHFFQNNSTTPRANDESFSDTGKSNSSSAPERIRIYEITTSNSTDSETERFTTARVDDSRESFNDNNENPSWTDFSHQSHGHGNNDAEFGARKNDANDFRSIDFDSSANRTNSPRHFRGNRKFGIRKISARKRTFSQSWRNDWTRRTGQRFHFFTFNEDTTNRDMGSVPGVPGRDYPIHQEHTHHHLRNVVDRFPCPRSPRSHVYLADRASRCQIFYVCYGSETGVPMVCPNGTLFSEPLQVCDWWYNVAC